MGKITELTFDDKQEFVNRLTKLCSIYKINNYMMTFERDGTYSYSYRLPEESTIKDILAMTTAAQLTTEDFLNDELMTLGEDEL